MQLNLFLLYLGTLAVFLVLDMMWLGWLGRDLYQEHLGQWLADKVTWPAAIAFYLLFIAGLLYFAVWPTLAGGTAGRALFNGAFFGLVAYATYELTNLATHKDWPIQAVIIDMLWGTVLCALVAWASFHLGAWLGLSG